MATTSNTTALTSSYSYQGQAIKLNDNNHSNNNNILSSAEAMDLKNSDNDVYPPDILYPTENDDGNSSLFDDGNSSWFDDEKMVTMRPSEPNTNFYQHYHHYITVIFIALVITFILCSTFYVGIKKRRHRQKKSSRSQRDSSRRSFGRCLSRNSNSSQSTLSNYQSFSSRRSNNRHARLTSQRSWADPPLTGVESPFFDEVFNKSLPSSLEPGSVHMSPLSPHAYQQKLQFNSGPNSPDMNSSRGELAKFYRHQQQHLHSGAASPIYDVRSASASPRTLSENKRHQIALPELKSASGIVVQISNMDLISTTIPRNPFPERRRFKPLQFSPSSSTRSSCDCSPVSMSPLDTPSGEFRPLGTICEEKPEGQKSTTSNINSAVVEDSPTGYQKMD